MIDLTVERTFPLMDVIRHQKLPPGRNGKRLHLSTLLRWVIDGVRTPDGARVRLEAIRVGARWLTSDAALQRFAERLTPRMDDTPAPIPTPTRQRDAAERAGKALSEFGI